MPSQGATIGIATGIFAGIALVAIGGFIAVYGKEYPTMKKADSIKLIVTLVITAVICLWLQWVSAYLMQTNPMISPERSEM